jgi:hypothetical protein
LLVVASLDQVCDLQSAVRTALLTLASIPDYPDATWIWSAVVTVLATAVTVRLAVEMRACRLAVAGSCVALACCVAQQAAALDWVLETRGVFRDMALAGLVLGGNIHVFLALCLYARHVYRDASGEITPKVRVAKPRVRLRRARSESAAAQSSPSAASSPAATTKPVKQSKDRVDPLHTATPPVAAQKEVTPRATVEVARATPNPHGPLSVARQSASDEESDEDAAGTALSKAERRRQRKLQRRENRHS